MTKEEYELLKREATKELDKPKDQQDIEFLRAATKAIEATGGMFEEPNKPQPSMGEALSRMPRAALETLLASVAGVGTQIRGTAAGIKGAIDPNSTYMAERNRVHEEFAQAMQKAAELYAESPGGGGISPEGRALMGGIAEGAENVGLTGGLEMAGDVIEAVGGPEARDAVGTAATLATMRTPSKATPTLPGELAVIRMRQNGFIVPPGTHVGTRPNGSPMYAGTATERTAARMASTSTVEDAISMHNQGVVQKWAAKAAGLPEGQVTPGGVARATAEANSAYEAIKGLDVEMQVPLLRVPGVRKGFVRLFRTGTTQGGRGVWTKTPTDAAYLNRDGVPYVDVPEGHYPGNAHTLQPAVEARARRARPTPMLRRILDLADNTNTLRGAPNPEIVSLQQRLLSVLRDKTGRVPNVVDAIRELRDAGFYNSQAARQAGGANMRDLSTTQRQAAGILEDSLDGFLTSLSKEFQDPATQAAVGKLHADWTAARSRLSTLHVVRDAMNPETGSLDASVIAKAGETARLHPDLQRIADAYAVNPKALRATEVAARTASAPLSAVDTISLGFGATGAGAGYMAGGAKGAAIGGLAAIAPLVTRMIARQYALRGTGLRAVQSATARAVRAGARGSAAVSAMPRFKEEEDE